MISWNTLCYNLTALAELPNGGGAEKLIPPLVDASTRTSEWRWCRD